MECCRGSGDRAGTAARLGVLAEPPQPEEVHPGAARPRPDRHPGREPGHDLDPRDGRLPAGGGRVRAILPPRPAGVAAVGLRRRHLRTITQPQVPGGRDRREEGQAGAADDVQPAPGAASAAGGHDPVRRGRGPEPDHRPHPRRIRALDQRRRTVLVVHARRDARRELPQPRSGARLGHVLLPERAERAARLVPRPRARHHPARTPTPAWPAHTCSGTTSSNASSTPASCPRREIPLVIQDKTFVDGSDPNYVWGDKGDLWYPYLYEIDDEPTGRWDYGPRRDPARGRHRTAARALGGSGVLRRHDDGERGSLSVRGGAAAPLPVPGAQRLAGALLNLQLYYADGPGKEADLHARPDRRCTRSAPRAGSCPSRCALNHPHRADRLRREREREPVHPAPRPGRARGRTHRLLRRPGRRAAHPLQRRARAVPRRAIRATTTSPAIPTRSATGGAPQPHRPGCGPNTRTLLQIRVVPRVGVARPARPSTSSCRRVAGSALAERRRAAAVLRGARRAATLRAGPPADAVHRNLTLNEDFDELGRLVQRLGTAEPGRRSTTRACPPGAATTRTPTTETPRAGRGRGLEDLQPHRRHAPHPLPPGQRPGALAPALRIRRPGTAAPPARTGPRPGRQRARAGRRRCG